MRCATTTWFGLAILAVLAAGPVVADPVTGKVTIRTKANAGSGTAIVFAEPVQGSAPSQPAKARLEQKDKAFRPGVLAVPVGSTIEFPNTDPIFHNVFSLSTPEPFDLGLYRAGSAKARTFAQPGYYWVFCNIHPQMAAFLAVVPTPWVTLADAQGSFRLELPRGKYRLTALSERSTPVTVDLTVSGATPAPEVIIDETAWVGLTHRNKFGQEYPASAYDKRR